MFGLLKRSSEIESRPTTGMPMRWCLDRGTFWLLELDAGACVYLKCLSGKVWVTRSGDSSDYILREADEIWLQGPGTILAEGMCGSMLYTFNRGGDTGVIEHGTSPERHQVAS
jgi:hypothetical protein